MRFGLQENVIKQINSIFAKSECVEKAIIYGSRAKGNFKPGSDIDFTLIGKKLNLQELNKIDLMLDDLILPQIFDLSIFRYIHNPDLIQHINRMGKVFFQR
ncbi:MAG: nucleotidyltransferase domain-containing protein [Candidatus Cloacimonadota bacterium]|nr:nucleotidyltransferase domain-containing protein [Candidatus Cloacimonadota bacterium]